MTRDFLFSRGPRRLGASSPSVADQRVLRIAHRGASGYAPENTWPAFHKAIELAVDMIELDVRRTRDHELVVCHDAWLNRLAGAPVALRAVSYAQLQQHSVNGQPIPRLADVLRTLAVACEVNVELKERGLAETAATVVKALDCHARVLFSSFLSAELLRLKAIDPRFRVAALLTAAPATVGTCLRFAALVQAEAIVVSHTALRRRLLTAAHRAGVKVFVWTVDDPEAIAHLKTIGVDGIMSNYPDRI